MNNLTKRMITATVGAAFIIGCIVWNVYSFCAVMFLLSLAVHIEYMSTIQNFKEGKRRLLEWILVLATGISFFMLFLIEAIPGMTEKEVTVISLLVIPLFLSIFIYELFANRKFPFQNAGLNIAGIFYCVMPFILLCMTGLFSAGGMITNDQAYQPWIVLGYFFIVWSNDVFAYFAGRLFGKHKLFERISPNKTWEGFFGGTIAAIGCALGLSYFFDFITRTDWLAIAVIVSVFGTLGDLSESMLKRSVNLKDSSSILPGHGGFLDRFDATLIAAPFVFTYLMLRL